MTKITIPAKTPEHAATETALRLALKRIETLERSIRAAFAGGVVIGLACGVFIAAVGVAT